MITLKYILFFLVLLILSYFYEKIKKDESKNTSAYYFKMIDQFLLTPESLGKNNKPCLWIHLHNDNITIPSTNQRDWINFSSRNSTNFNQPYQFLTIKSIIKHCKNDFNICLINDLSFKKIIPNWSLDIENTANPLRTHIRSIALCNILNIYGGMLVPSSFICFKSLKSMYNQYLNDNNFFVGEFVNRTNINQSFQQNFVPYTYIMGSTPNNNVMKEFIKHQEILISKDFTFEMDFVGNINFWLQEKINNNSINLINGNYIGTVDNFDNPIIIDMLISNKYLELNSNAYGLYIPWDELINRLNLQWFVYLSPKDVLESNTNIDKYLLISNEN